jgi:hypothetical protein
MRHLLLVVAVLAVAGAVETAARASDGRPAVVAYRAKVNAICRRTTQLMLASRARAEKAARGGSAARERVLREALEKVTDLQDLWLAIPVPASIRGEMRRVRADHAALGRVFRRALAQRRMADLTATLDEADSIGGGFEAIDRRTDAAGLVACGSGRTSALNG